MPSRVNKDPNLPRNEIQVLPVSNVSDGTGATPTDPAWVQNSNHALRHYAHYWANNYPNVQVQAGMTVELSQLPPGYTAWDRPRPNPRRNEGTKRRQEVVDHIVCGHPNGDFRSAPDFCIHLNHLQVNANTVGCLCTLCRRTTASGLVSTPLTHLAAAANGGPQAQLPASQQALAQQLSAPQLAIRSGQPQRSTAQQVSQQPVPALSPIVTSQTVQQQTILPTAPSSQALCNANRELPPQPNAMEVDLRPAQPSHPSVPADRPVPWNITDVSDGIGVPCYLDGAEHNDNLFLVSVGRHHTSVMKNLPAGHFYRLNHLPRGYSGWEVPALDAEGTHALLLGHPSGRFFSSAEDFYDHLVWLQTRDLSGGLAACPCSLCSGGSPAPAGSKIMEE